MGEMKYTANNFNTPEERIARLKAENQRLRALLAEAKVDTMAYYHSCDPTNLIPRIDAALDSAMSSHD